MEEQEFYEKVGMLMERDLDLLASLGFKNDAGNGEFDTDKLGEMVRFCEEHPEYHIVTVVDTDGTTSYLNTVAFVNRMGYYLANGDKDESLFTDIPRYDEEEKQVARQAKEYLKKHGVWLSWKFSTDDPPTQEVEEFLLNLEGDFFDLGDAEAIVFEQAIDVIESEWGLDDEEEEGEE